MIFDPTICRSNVKYSTRRPSKAGRQNPWAKQPLRVKRCSRQVSCPTAQYTHVQLPRLYVKFVICSEIKPIRKMITAALNSNTLMLVSRCWVPKV